MYYLTSQQTFYDCFRSFAFYSLSLLDFICLDERKNDGKIHSDCIYKFYFSSVPVCICLRVCCDIKFATHTTIGNVARLLFPVCVAKIKRRKKAEK